MPRLLFCLLATGLLAQETSDLTRALSSSRQRIDTIDGQIVSLLNQRAAIVREVGLLKLKFHAPAAAPGREEEILRRVSSQARAPLSAEDTKAIYRAILAEMASMEQREMAKAAGR